MSFTVQLSISNPSTGPTLIPKVPELGVRLGIPRSLMVHLVTWILFLRWSIVATSDPISTPEISAVAE